jgi:dihydroceramidase
MYTDPMQLVDELSMIYTTCIMCYATFTYGRGLAYSVIMGVSLLSCAVFITGYYHYVQEPAFHQISYALLTAVVLLRSIYVMETSIRPNRRAKEASLRATAASLETVRKNRSGVTANGHASEAEYTIAEQKRKDVRDVKILDSMWTMIVVGLAFFLGGFCIWNLDNMYCTTLRRWRREVGLPWGIVLEGHGWWYVSLCALPQTCLDLSFYRPYPLTPVPTGISAPASVPTST